MPATMQKIGEILESGQLTKGEQWVVKWQFRLLGDFETALSGAIKQADEKNLLKLARGFPDQVEGFLAWNRGNLGTRLREMGLEI